MEIPPPAEPDLHLFEMEFHIPHFFAVKFIQTGNELTVYWSVFTRQSHEKGVNLL
jgi:hypothetical protein